jgi:mono/diheme cytochrome c family protein
VTSRLAYRVSYAVMVLGLAAACTPAADTGASAPATEMAAPASIATPDGPVLSGPAAPNTTDTLSNTPPDQPVPATASAAPAPSPEEIISGRSAYSRACAMCHGPAGQGTPAGVALTQKDTALITEKIVKGGEKMPPMAAVLAGDEVDDVAKFVAAGLPQ